MPNSLTIAADDGPKLREYLNAYGVNNTLIEPQNTLDGFETVLVSLAGQIWIGALTSALGAALEGYFEARADIPNVRIRIALGNDSMDFTASTVGNIRQRLEAIITESDRSL